MVKVCEDLYQEYGITNEILESRGDDTHDDSTAS